MTLHLDASLPADIQRAAHILREGGLVAFPTETVYGLGANALSAEAVAGIFAAKQRPSWDPLIVHVADLQSVAAVARVEGETERRFQMLADAFWPGPLTLLLPRTAAIRDEVTSGRPLVGVRVPAHPAALALLRETGLPLAAPSANRFGHTSPTTARHVLDDLDGRIDAVLDGGPCAVGVESTVVDPQLTPIVIYRSGAVTVRDFELLGLAAQLFLPPEVDPSLAAPASLPSPGFGMRHYAPKIPVELTDPEEASFRAVVQRALAGGSRVGVLLPLGWSEQFSGEVRVESWGAWDDATAMARKLFAGLRALESTEIDCIICPLPNCGDLRDALRDRLTKAARTH